jgi:hypothetical protein
MDPTGYQSEEGVDDLHVGQIAEHLRRQVTVACLKAKLTTDSIWLIPDSIMSQRLGYVKSVLVQLKGFQNCVPCESCRPAFEQRGNCERFIGYVSMPGYNRNKCSNCLHTDAKCSKEFDTRDDYRNLTLTQFCNKQMFDSPNQMYGRPQARGG